MNAVLELQINTRNEAPKLMEELTVGRKASLCPNTYSSGVHQVARDAFDRLAEIFQSAGMIIVYPGEFFCGFHNDVDTNFVGVARITCDMYLLRQGDIIETEREFASELYKLRQYFFMRVQPMCGNTMKCRSVKDPKCLPDGTEPLSKAWEADGLRDERIDRLDGSLAQSIGNNSRRLSAIESRLEALLSAVGGGAGCVMPAEG